MEIYSPAQLLDLQETPLGWVTPSGEWESPACRNFVETMLSLVPELSARVWQAGATVVLRADSVDEALQHTVTSVARLWLQETGARLWRCGDERLAAARGQEVLIEILSPGAHAEKYGSTGLVDAFFRPQTSLCFNTNPLDFEISHFPTRVRSTVTLARLLSSGIILLVPPVSNFCWEYVATSIEQKWRLECDGILNSCGSVECAPEGGEESGQTCAICINSFESGCQVFVTDCGHTFHLGCFIQLRHNGNSGVCPVCRQPLEKGL